MAKKNKRYSFQNVKKEKLVILSALLVVLMALITTSVFLVVNHNAGKREMILVSVDDQQESETGSGGIREENKIEVVEPESELTPETEMQTEVSAETDTLSETEELTEMESTAVPKAEPVEEIVDDGVLRVILDAGHGGKDGGTYSGSLIEKNVNLDIVMLMKPLLEAKGVEVVLSRDTDKFLKLEDRTYLANRTGGTLFVSIHCNYYQEGSTISGVECYYYDKSKKSRKCAETVISQLKAGGKLTVRNAKDADYYVLVNTYMPAILVEVGYLSSSTDRQNLGSSQYKETMAQELVNGIWNYLESTQVKS